MQGSSGALYSGWSFLLFFFLAVTLGSVAGSRPALAQEPEEEIIKELEREAEAGAKAGKAAGEAEKRRAGRLKGTISFKNVLADPDNIDLNFLYAKQQVAAGELRGAAATLERILLINPALSEIRLFYAIVLFRLDNIDEAERAFLEVAALDIPANIRAEVEDYLSRIEQRRKRTRFALSISQGFHLDTNRDAAPKTKTRLFADTPLAVRGAQQDTSWLTIASVFVTHDLGFQDRHELIGSFTFYNDRNTVLDNLDVQSYGVMAGGVVRVPWFDFTPTLHYTQTRINLETYLRTYSGKLRFDREFTTRISGYLEGEFGYQKYAPISELQAAWQRDGKFWNIELGGAYILTPTQRISVSWNREFKRAQNKYNGYIRHRLSAAHTWLLGGGQFLLTTGTVGKDFYDRNDPFVSGTRRLDDTYRLRLTYGAPLDFFSDLVADYALHRHLGDILLTLTGEQYWAVSDLPNYSYRNSKLQVMLTKKWNL